MQVAHLIVDNAGSDPPRPKSRRTAASSSAAAARWPKPRPSIPDAKLSGTDGYHARPDRVAAPRRARAGGQEGQRDLLDHRCARTARMSTRRSIAIAIPTASTIELIQAWTRTQVQMRHVGVTSQEAASFQMLGRYLVYPDMQLRADSATVQAGLASAVGALAADDLGRFPDLRRAHQRRYRSRHRAGSPEGAGISAFARRHRRSGDRQRACLVLRPGHAAHAGCDVRKPAPARSVATGRASISSRFAAISWSRRPGRRFLRLRARSSMRATARSRPDCARGNAVRDACAVRRKRSLIALLCGHPPRIGRRGRAAEINGDGLDFWNGYGGFADDGREYVDAAARRRSDAAAVDQRHLQRALRLPCACRRRRPSPGAAIRATTS